MVSLVLLLLLIGQYAAMEHPAQLPNSLVSPEPREGVADYLPGNSPLTSPPIYSIDMMPGAESAIDMPTPHEESIIRSNEDPSSKVQTSQSEETPAQGFNRLSWAHPDPSGSTAVAFMSRSTGPSTTGDVQVRMQTRSRALQFEGPRRRDALIASGSVGFLVVLAFLLTVTFYWIALRKQHCQAGWIFALHNLNHIGRKYPRGPQLAVVCH
ncbi:hypothetical protein PTTG_28974 [Puccinia triticina 1-1 BBBD Race 1]|uniref:Uncharacterized protein n=2 Tax=Puccinia triticina TaxID=208348 RepID=A0A180G8G4_PUCT1|nr:hypothetical protein PTTG_28974 [Puccinia triticina 1-1 BBBD Race 1]WAR57101.1 hypothetical protein PtB15_8B147 [Puccinia triticina]